MEKRTIVHSLTVTVVNGDTYAITDESDALVVLEQFKRGQVLAIPTNDCVVYVPYASVVSVKDCPTTNTETVEDNVCVPYP